MNLPEVPKTVTEAYGNLNDWKMRRRNRQLEENLLSYPRGGGDLEYRMNDYLFHNTGLKWCPKIDR